VTYDEIHPTIRAFIGGHEGLRRLGFVAADIYCCVQPSVSTRELACFVTLRTQGKEFNMEAGPLPEGDDQEKFFERYKPIATAVLEGCVPQHVLDRIWEESPCHRHRAAFVLALRAKGLTFPRHRR
jgi:hypothetical protein